MKFPLVIFLLLPVCVAAQDITGVWKGYIKTPGSQLEYELAISSGGKWLNAYSLIIYPKDGIDNIGIKTARIKQSKEEIYFEDGELVYDNFTTQPRRVKMFGNLYLAIRDTLMILQGNFSTRSLDFRDTRTYSGEVYLQRSVTPPPSKLLVTLDETSLPYNLSFTSETKKKTEIKRSNSEAVQKEKRVTAQTAAKPQPKTERKIEKIRDIFFSSDSLQLTFYDNGTIDGDTVSMVLNGRIIAEKIKLSTNAFRVTIPTKIGQYDSLILVLHAESLGLIPPNTGLLIIQDGTTRHEIRFEGDLQRSSAIVLRRKPE
jgi:hypothetical protein